MFCTDMFGLLWMELFKLMLVHITYDVFSSALVTALQLKHILYFTILLYFDQIKAALVGISNVNFI